MRLFVFFANGKALIKSFSRQIKTLERDIREKDEELYTLRELNERLSLEVNNAQTDYRAVNDDYKTLIQIMDRARRLTVLTEEDEAKPRFKMDANGNLERIE